MNAIQQYIIKNFKKKSCVKIIYFGDGRKSKTIYVIPKDNTVSFDNKSFMLDEKSFTLDENGYITYVFNFKRLEPIDPTMAKTLGTIIPSEFDVALNSRVASEILTATKNKADVNMLLVLMMVVTVLGFAVLWYTLNEQLTAILEYLNQLQGVAN